MSLTQRIKQESSREYLASDGTIYLLQRVDMQELFITEGLLPDLTAMLLEEDSSELDLEAAREKAMKAVTQNPALAMRGVRTVRMMLERGLIGEKGPDGGIIIYRHVDKSAILLGEGEVNVALIPTELQTELAEAIMSLTPKPRVGGSRFREIPGEEKPAQGGADQTGA